MVTRDELLSLSESRPLAVSLYLPTHRAGKPTRENSIRMKNRIWEVRALLDEHGWDDRQIDELLGPALELLDDYEFWQHQLDGLALFLSDGEEHRVQAERELPDLSVVGPRYHLKPLIPLLNEQGAFYVLAASLGKSRLFEVTGTEVREVDLPEDTPRSLAQSQRFSEDEPEDRTVRRHTGAKAGSGAFMENQGRGGGPEYPDRKTEILDFFRMLDNGVREVVEGSERPLLFMGVDYLFPLYREANHYPKLIEDEAVAGNPDQWSPDEIKDRSWELMRERFERPRREAEEKFGHQSGTGNTGVELEEILLAGIAGRIDTLFVALDRQRWGTFDPENRFMQEAQGHTLESEDLLDRAAVQALQTGAAVFPVPAAEVPGDGDVAAIYRF